MLSYLYYIKCSNSKVNAGTKVVYFIIYLTFLFMKKYMSVGFSFLIAFGFLFSTSTVSAAIILSDSFGNTSIDDVPGWIDGGGDKADDTYTTNGTNRDGSPTTQNARMRDGGHISKTISTLGHNNITFKYYWRGDNHGDGSSDNLKVYWKKTSDSDSDYSLINTHQLNNNEIWSSQVSVSLPIFANNTSIDVRFLGESNKNDEEARVDDVSIEGTIIDTTAPVIASHTNILAEATSASGAVVSYTAPNATDNVDATAPAVCTPASGSTFALGTNVVTCNKTDVAGNVATPTTFNITVSDTTKPAIKLIGSSDLTIQAGTTYTDAGSNVTDNVNTGLVATVTGSVNTTALGDYTLSFNVTDSNGNVADTVTKIVHVIDTTKPVITLTGGNMSIHTGDTFTDPGSSATDNLDVLVTVNITGGPVTTTAPGTFTLKYNAVDSQGNNATEKTRKVTVVDLTVPIIKFIGTGSVDVLVGATYTDAGATATDDVDGNLTSSIVTDNPVNTSLLGTYTVTYNVSDSSSNTAAQITRTVNVVDTIAPVIVLNGSNPMNLKKGEAYVEPGATAIDNYDIGPITVVITGILNTAIPATYTKTYSATDSTVNTSSKTRTVIVRNLGTNANLSALVPSAGTLNPEFNSKTTSYTVVLPFGTTTIPTVSATTSDEFATKVITQSSSVTGTATVVVTSEDTDKETVVHKTYTVVFSVAKNPDHTAPVITHIGSSPVNVTVGDTYSDEGATALDNIDGNITKSIVTVNNVNTTVSGTYTVTYNVNDAAGNKATEVTRIVNVNNQRRSGGYLLVLTNPETGGQVLGAVKFIFTKNFKFGSKGNEVTELQKYLNGAGYDCGAVDGKFKAKTESCVKALQKANPPLKVDGIVGFFTRAVLNK